MDQNIYVCAFDEKTQADAREVLDFLKRNYTMLQKEMNLSLSINKITKSMLGNDRIIKGFRESGISKLPALRMPDGVIYLGVSNIIEYYTEKISDFKRSVATKVKDYDDVDTSRRQIISSRDQEDEVGEGKSDDAVKRMAEFQKRRDKRYRAPSAPEQVNRDDNRPQRQQPAPVATTGALDDDTEDFWNNYKAIVNTGGDD